MAAGSRRARQAQPGPFITHEQIREKLQRLSRPMAARLALLMAARLALLMALAAAAYADDKAVFQKVCGTCHAPTMVSDLKTESEWIETVANMTAIGAKGTDEEFTSVLRYLVRNFAKVTVRSVPEPVGIGTRSA